MHDDQAFFKKICMVTMQICKKLGGALAPPERLFECYYYLDKLKLTYHFLQHSSINF